MRTIQDRFRAKKEKDKLLILVDASPMAYQAMFVNASIPRSGLYASMVQSFLENTLSLAESFYTKRMVFIFDSKTSARKEIYPDYKKNRRDNLTPEDIKRYQIMDQFRTDLRKKILPSLGFSNIFVQKGREADDIIATICHQTLEDIMIVSTDADLYQCLAVNVCMISNVTGNITTLKSFQQKYGIFPSQWALVKEIGGCKTDKVKGCTAFIGEGRAIHYIKKTLNAKWTEKIVKAKEGRKRNRRLTVLPFEGTKTPVFNVDHFVPSSYKKLCRSFGLSRLIDRDSKRWEMYFRG